MGIAHAGWFFIQIGSRQFTPELIAECPTCGAMTTLSIAYAWRAKSAVCGECGTRMPVHSQLIRDLKTQAEAAVREIDRLLVGL